MFSESIVKTMKKTLVRIVSVISVAQGGKMLAKFKKTFIGDRAFYRRYIFLATPMIIQQAITNFVSFLDNLMVGQLGRKLFLQLLQ